MIGETSKLTLIIPPKRERKAPILVQSPYNSWLAELRMSLSQSQKFSDTPSSAYLPCILLMFSPVFPKCSNAQYKAQERNSDPALLFHRRLTCMTQRSGCLYCGSSRYSTT